MNLQTIPNYFDVASPLSEWRRVLDGMTVAQLHAASEEMTRYWLKIDSTHPHAERVAEVRELIEKEIVAAVARLFSW
jgi:hypothetical protein